MPQVGVRKAVGRTAALDIGRFSSARAHVTVYLPGGPWPSLRRGAGLQCVTHVRMRDRLYPAVMIWSWRGVQNLFSARAHVTVYLPGGPWPSLRRGAGLQCVTHVRMRDRLYPAVMIWSWRGVQNLFSARGHVTAYPSRAVVGRAEPFSTEWRICAHASREAQGKCVSAENYARLHV